MKSLDQYTKESFDKEWQRRLENSPYKLKEYWNYSNRQLNIWQIVTLNDSSQGKFTAKIINKPYYVDRFKKARYRWYLVCELEDETRFVAHIDNVYKK